MLSCNSSNDMCMGSACHIAVPDKSTPAAAMAHPLRGGLAGSYNSITSWAAAALPGIPFGPAALPCSHGSDSEGVPQKVTCSSHLSTGILPWQDDYAPLAPKDYQQIHLQ